MKRPKEILGESLEFIRRSQNRVAASARALEQSMDTPEGQKWEQEITATPEPEAPEPSEPKSAPLQSREQRWREQFTKSWFGRPKPKPRGR